MERVDTSGTIALFSPAKINLYLAVTGRRADGFHDLLSIVSQLDFGDTLYFQGSAATDETKLICENPEIPLDASNLILKAAHLFRAKTGWRGGVKIQLDKRIPVGAGLGGGSSNAVATLKGLNQLTGNLLPENILADCATSLGSDCALFLADAPIQVSGRGERVETLSASAIHRIRGRRILVFKPEFGISTVWSYQWMAARGDSVYEPAGCAHQQVISWLEGSASLESLLYNNLQQPAFSKYLSLPALLDQLRGRGVSAIMSGSGSACFALISANTDVREVYSMIASAWGESAFIKEVALI